MVVKVIQEQEIKIYLGEKKDSAQDAKIKALEDKVDALIEKLSKKQ
ncbi:hypothetical protein HYW94_04005 [Candidatus Uhrbacteria bacterium]|nr:hypothetical protein [Candidatus Uhrbacteria bacterium]